MIDILITVIVPVYNVEEYVEECLQSLIAQTYTKIEILLIDDGSTDKSGEICDQYAEIDERIQVIHKKNGGLVSARKCGLKIAKGKYISFVDADDWIDKNTYEKIFNCIQNHDADVIAFGLKEEYEHYSREVKNNCNKGIYKGETLEKLFMHLLCNGVFFEWGVLPHICDKVIKKELLEKEYKRVSSKITIGEDVACTYGCIINSHVVCILDISPYHYRQRQTSMMHKKKVEDESIKLLFKKIESDFKKLVNEKKVQNQICYYKWFILCLTRYERLAKERSDFLFPFRNVQKGAKIILYGAGGFGSNVCSYVNHTLNYNIVAWVDKNYDMPEKKSLGIESVASLQDKTFDYIIIAILNERIAEHVTESLVEMGVKRSKICYITKRIMEEAKIPEWLN